MFCLLVSAQTVKVQMTDGARKWYEPLPVPKTHDHKFLILTASSVLANVADVENSLVALRGQHVRELNPLYGQHPNRLRYYDVSLPITGALAYWSWRWKREDAALKFAGYPGHRFMKWWIPEALNIATHGAGLGFTAASTGR